MHFAAGNSVTLPKSDNWLQVLTDHRREIDFVCHFRVSEYHLWLHHTIILFSRGCQRYQVRERAIPLDFRRLQPRHQEVDDGKRDEVS